MRYIVVKAINNNVVLAKDSIKGEEAVLMSKGIGFGKKTGDFVDDDGSKQQIFKLWADTKEVKEIKYDEKILKSTVEDICILANKKMNIDRNDIYKPLLDHIAFSIDRIMFNIPMENPFQTETYVLYSREYEVAREAVEMLEKNINVKFGEAEIGFIALHLNSAVRNRPVSTSLNHIKLYNEIANLIYEEFGEYPENDFTIKVFLMSMAEHLKISKSGVKINMPWKKNVFKEAKSSYILALKISELVQKELKLELSVDSIGFITSDIEKLKQIYKMKED